MVYTLLNFSILGDHRGNLVVLEENIPFTIKRVYYIWGSEKAVIRGRHAHKTLEQVVICISGSSEFILDDGKQKNTVFLNSPQEGIYIKPLVWGEFTNFSINCVVLVLASEYYDEDEYIRDYSTFLALVNKK